MYRPYYALPLGIPKASHLSNILTQLHNQKVETQCVLLMCSTQAKISP